MLYQSRNQDGVISVVTQLLLGYQEILVRFPAGTKDLFLLQGFHIEYENPAVG
jgi:hypothetical protein